MALYTAISSISKKISELMQSELVPKLIPSEEYIGLAAPNERDNLMLGIFLYDIRESDEIKANQMIAGNSNTMRYPPVYLNLYYMMTAYADGDIQFRHIREEMILGGIIRFFHDNSIIMREEGDIPVKIELMKMSVEEKTKIWSFAGMPYKLSVFYKVSPVSIDSGRVKEVTRVSGVNIKIAEDGKIYRRNKA